MTRPVPSDPDAYDLVTWRVYGTGRTTKPHWCYPDARFGTRRYQALCGAVGDSHAWPVVTAGPICKKCEVRLAKIRAEHDAHHTTPSAAGV